LVEVAVDPAQARGLRRLGLLPGEPGGDRAEAVPAEALARAVGRLLDAALPLAEVAAALGGRGAGGT
jgi:hypothetical protein